MPDLQARRLFEGLQCPGPHVRACVAQFVTEDLDVREMENIASHLQQQCLDGTDALERSNKASCLLKPLRLGKDFRNGHDLYVRFECSGCIIPDSCGARIYYPKMPGPDCKSGARLNSAYPTPYCMPQEFLVNDPVRVPARKGPCEPGDPMCEF